MTADQYREHLDALLPQGLAWPRENGSDFSNLLAGMAEEFSRIDVRGDDLMREVLPSLTIELLTEWERVAGLPDPCVSVNQTVQQRRASLLAKLTNAGGQSRAFFIALAEYLGFTVTITEFRPFRAGINRAGDPICSEDWWFAWRVNAPQTTSVFFRAGLSAAGEPLQAYGNELLECVFNRVKPAHTVLIFAYGG